MGTHVSSGPVFLTKRNEQTKKRHLKTLAPKSSGFPRGFHCLRGEFSSPASWHPGLLHTPSSRPSARGSCHWEGPLGRAQDPLPPERESPRGLEEGPAVPCASLSPTTSLLERGFCCKGPPHPEARPLVWLSMGHTAGKPGLAPWPGLYQLGVCARERAVK